MSQRRERLADSVPDPVLDAVASWYHVPVLLLLVAFMLWIRVRNWRNFIVEGQVYFSGNDAWYHLRQVQYTVRNWPSTMPMDPWTGFPEGATVGQFGTLYDQLVATAALVIGGGSPSAQTTALTLLFAPAVLGTLVAIPAYFLGKRFGGRLGGLVGVAVLAFSPGSFLSRSIAGFSDHHAAEVFFQVLAVALLVVAIVVGEREKPIYEQFVERDVSNLRKPVGWAALAGLGFTLYVWSWPPGVLLVGVFGVFLLVALPLQFLRDESPEHLAIVGAVSLGVAGVLLLATFDTTEVSASSFSLLQPLLALVGAVGCVFLAWLARVVERSDYPSYAYPGTILGLFVAVVVVMAVALPDLLGFFVNQIVRTIGLGSNATALTVGEAQPPYSAGAPFGQAVSQAVGFLFNSYAFALVGGAVGAVLMLFALARGRLKHRTAAGFVLLWTGFMLAATLTQSRFDYYLVTPVAVLNAYLVGWVVDYFGETDARATLRSLRLRQVLTVVVVVLFITAPLAVGGSAGTVTTAGSYADQGSTPGSTVQGWDGALEWLNTSTPAEGTYGGADNEMGYYERYDRTDDFDYPDGSYGVMSWWDYGHWITVLGHRIPVANPFQQNAHEAANFLLAPNESRANQIATTPEGEGDRYVMIDWRMGDVAGGALYTVPYTWYNDGPISLADDVFVVANQTSGSQFVAYNQRHYETMRTRLYAFHGSAIEPEPVVIDYDTTQATSSGVQARVTSGNHPTVREFDTMSDARAYVRNDSTSQIGGVGKYSEEYVPALQHYRLVNATETSGLLSSQSFYQSLINQNQSTGLSPNELYATPQNWVKTFERVDGATVEGQGPPNSTVEASVELQMPPSPVLDDTFTYTQRANTSADGSFTMTLPYSTTGYDQWGPEQGATNVSIRATGPYTFETAGANDTGPSTTVDVPEGAVIGRTDGQVTVDLQQGSASGANASNATTNASATSNATANASATSKRAPVAEGAAVSVVR
ncbi:oligosaccharyl transferase, archaeosortase A system-associated [Halococcus sp. IIIV-5B]|uniref:oligosaccharyl transferase, archaeosortase A system-associated n=1 Tax=Halococcus sp. IIIV-5B TaxID=2321230 RepID=UPI000E727957|nr:oligosaccharyl transferase, archaeosortase A system-associated [Halococcus sp. IIIV-5B]RJT05322.1 oligosaccharyl transferase, archaeosortase A system-associated [Halococcus sp. IIIV-5B]